MKKHCLKLKSLSFLLAGIILFTSCASTTMIHSVPEGAKLYLDGEPVGSTPYSHRDKKIVGSNTALRFEKEGYETLETSFSRDEEVDVGAIIGGVFVLIPFLWVMKYKPSHTYELTEISADSTVNIKTDSKKRLQNSSKAERLRELKELLDENILTQEEYDQQKKKILDED